MALVRWRNLAPLVALVVALCVSSGPRAVVQDSPDWVLVAFGIETTGERVYEFVHPDLPGLLCPQLIRHKRCTLDYRNRLLRDVVVEGLRFGGHELAVTSAKLVVLRQIPRSLRSDPGRDWGRHPARCRADGGPDRQAATRAPTLSPVGRRWQALPSQFRNARIRSKNSSSYSCRPIPSLFSIEVANGTPSLASWKMSLILGFAFPAPAGSSKYVTASSNIG